MAVGLNTNTLCFSPGLKISLAVQNDVHTYPVSDPVIWPFLWAAPAPVWIKYSQGTPRASSGPGNATIRYSPYLTAEQQREGLYVHIDKYYQGTINTRQLYNSCMVHLG